MSTAKDQIQGWKEIAAYLRRDERTAKRWEKQRGLPVRRIPGGGRANVYILISELETWLVEGKASAQADDTGAGTQHSASTPVQPVGINPLKFQEGSAVEAEAVAGPGTSTSLQQQPGSAARSRRWVWPLAAASVLAALLLWVHAAKPTNTAINTPARSHTMYRSPVRGADELYLQGVYFFEERTPSSLESAHKTFSEVIERDPNDAPAYTGLAETYLLQREYATRDSREAYQLAREAAEKALTLDSQLPEAHAVLGFIDFFSDFNARDATEQFRTAIRLDAGCVLAHHWYGSMMTHQGRYAEALEELNQAQRLAPTSTAVISSKAYALGLSGHRDEAITMLDRVMAVDPDAPSPPRISAHLSMQTPHDVPRFLAQSERFAKLRHDTEESRLIDRMASAYHRGGEAAMWASVDHTMLSPPWAESSDELVEAEAQAGHIDRAIQMLLQLEAKRDTRLLNLKINPLFASLSADPRYRKMLLDLNLTYPN